VGLLHRVTVELVADSTDVTHEAVISCAPASNRTYWMGFPG
jgi:hypothetical protein